MRRNTMTIEKKIAYKEGAEKVKFLADLKTRFEKAKEGGFKGNIREFILKKLQEKKDAQKILNLTTKDNLIKIGLLDSMSFIELLTSIELAYNVEIDFSDLDPNQFITIDGLSKYSVKCMKKDV